ncbi:MAG TPA: Tm-1-like ATP-binding domain-containing protein, partial [Caulifigura sp.]|nr:Tm-1-like ATP-binding domain-containing protein [Caulifigura sp.]
MRPAVYAVATMDTKGDEIAFVARQIEAAGAVAVTVDVGTQLPPTTVPTITRDAVAAVHPKGAAFVLSQTDRGAAVEAMSEALTRFLVGDHQAGRVAGVIGIGGSGGTALITRAMRALPVGLPKLMVSTVASGNVAPYVDCSDITLMPSVVDVAGINAVSAPILANAAHAIAGMAVHEPPKASVKPIVGMTMFGVTTACVTAVRGALESQGFDCLVFHATGAGGRAMEKLVESGLIKGVLDVTTTEVADEVVGGVFAAGPKRFEAILASGVPYVMSLGALDMVNFGAPETVPAPFRDRRLHRHNAQVTLM